MRNRLTRKGIEIMRINLTLSAIKQYFPDITNSLGHEIPAFPTVEKCRAFALKIGWGNQDIIRVSKRFERVYIVGKKPIHTSLDACGNIVESIHIPTGNYVDGEMQVIEIRKIGEA